MDTVQTIGAVGIIALIAFIGVWSGRKVKTAEQFTTAGGKNGALMVMGIALGTLIGGACTIGTAQLSYQYGFAGWWYTLGTAGGCFVLAFCFIKVFRNSGFMTVPGIIRNEYGMRVDVVTSFVLSIGFLLSLTSQMISATAVLPAIFPGLNKLTSLALEMVFILICVLVGGSLSAGEMGKVKAALLIVISVFGAVIVLNRTGISELYGNLGEMDYFNLFSRGTGFEISNALGVILGVICTQANFQAILSARDVKASRRGMVFSGLLCPVCGFAGVLIGMFMRIREPGIVASQAFPLFLTKYTPKLIGGIGMGTLLITLTLSAAGTSLGCSTVIVKDIIGPFSRKVQGNSEKQLKLMRVFVVVILLLAALLGSGLFGDTILNFSFLAMGLRAVSLVIPFLFATYLPEKVDRRFVLLGTILGPLCVIVFGFWKVLPVDALYVGLLASFICCLAGYFKGKKGADDRS